MLKRDDDWKLSYQPDIMHKMKSLDTKPNMITAMSWMNDSVLATSGSDKVINFWDFSNK